MLILMLQEHITENTPIPFVDLSETKKIRLAQLAQELLDKPSTNLKNESLNRLRNLNMELGNQLRSCERMISQCGGYTIG